MSKTNLVIIGNGMVGHRFVEELLDKGKSDQFNITIFCKEPRLAYDRVHLSSYFSVHSTQALSLVRNGLYEKHHLNILLDEKAILINRQRKEVHSQTGRIVPYDKLIIATGSYPWIPPIQGAQGSDCFVYRTIEDLDAIKSRATYSKSCAIVGGGLLGLEAAGAVKNLGMETHVIEFSPVLMAEQLDVTGGEQLRHKIEQLGVRVHTSTTTREIVDVGIGKLMKFADETSLNIDFIVFSTGIRPYDELAKTCQLNIGSRGGIEINNYCQTSDPDIYAIGECASWQGKIFGLVSPGYKMAQIALGHLLGEKSTFTGADMSSKLKLLGVDVGSIGDAKGRTPGCHSYSYLDESAPVYKKLIVSADNKKLLGAILVGDTSDYGNLLQLMLNNMDLPTHPDTLILPTHGGAKPVMGVDSLPNSAHICSCYDVTKEKIVNAINSGCHTPEAIKAKTRAGTGCGGCVPIVSQLLNVELKKQGIEVSHALCSHFKFSRQELYHLIRVEELKSFKQVLKKYGNGYGCEICKPTIASLLASCWNEYILKPDLIPLQDSNDIFLANIQKNGTYSVIPRAVAGEITPDGLIVLGRIAKKYHLYSKITGSQRIALFGVQKDDLPAIWKELIEAGFETGHAYAKSLRMVKTCVGNTWCRFGVGDSVGLAAELENRYKGIRSPHKMKLGVSGCTRECAEAQSKDVGIIASEKGWNLYVCGNGGVTPRHADLLASDVDKKTLIRYLDRFMMFYIRTGDKLQRTAHWLESLDGGIEYIRRVIIDDALGINANLEQEMSRLRALVVCEWKTAVEDTGSHYRFSHFINSSHRDENVQQIPERNQYRPATYEERKIILEKQS